MSSPGREMRDIRLPAPGSDRQAAEAAVACLAHRAIPERRPGGWRLPKRKRRIDADDLG